MSWKNTIKLKDGRVVVLRDLSKRDSPKQFVQYINTMTRERVYFLIDRMITLKEEKAWIKDNLKKIKKGEMIFFVLEDNGRIVGSFDAVRQRYKLRNNVLIGLGMLKKYREQGIGYFALKELIARVKKEMKPKHIYLTVYSENKRARNLYLKLGFRHHHTLKNWINHYGKYMDEEFMILKK